MNVETSAVTPAIYFYNQMGEMIDADSVVDVSGDLAVAGDGALTVPMGIAGRGEITISTNGEGALVVGSVRVFGTGRLGGVLRFDIPAVGVAGVGASEPVSDAIFPARRMVGGINRCGDPQPQRRGHDGHLHADAGRRRDGYGHGRAGRRRP